MPRSFRRAAPPLIALLTLALAAPALGQPVLRGATLPSARTVATDATATAFFTVLNAGDAAATNCAVATSTFVGSDLDDYIITSQVVEGGAATGPVDPVFDIPAAGRVDMVVGVRRDPGASFNTNAHVFFRVECDDGHASPAWPAVNQVRAQFRDNAPDILPIIDTVTRNGIVEMPDGRRVGLITAAAINIGAPDAAEGFAAPHANEATIGVGGRYTGFRDAGQLGFRLCRIDADGVCITERVECAPRQRDCLVTQIGDEPAFFAFFIDLPEDRGAPFLPNYYRFEPVFDSASTFSDAASSAALRAPEPPAPRDGHSGQYEIVVRNTGEAEGQTINVGYLTLTPDAGYGYILRAIDRGFFTQLVPQRFAFTHEPAPDGAGPDALLDHGLDEIAAWAVFATLLTGGHLDHYSVEPDRVSPLTVTPGVGAGLTATAGETEQIPGEEEIFDFGAAFTLQGSPILALNDERFNAMPGLDLTGVTSDDFESIEFVMNDNLPATSVSRTMELQLDACGLVLELQAHGGGGPEGPFPRYMTARADLAGCPPGHLLARIFEVNGSSPIEVPALVTPGADGRYLVEFTLSGGAEAPPEDRAIIVLEID